MSKNELYYSNGKTPRGDLRQSRRGFISKSVTAVYAVYDSQRIGALRVISEKSLLILLRETAQYSDSNAKHTASHISCH